MLRKHNESGASSDAPVIRTRRAYFEMRFGQLHVRTAFPATGGFDEQPPLFCVHPAGQSGRLFDRFLALIADRRSVYAPDLPGCGESDPAPGSPADAGAAALRDLAADLRLRRIDLLAAGDGAAAALAVAAEAPELVRRIVLVDARDPLRAAPGVRPAVRAECLELPDRGEDPVVRAPEALAQRVVLFLDRA